MTFCSVLPTGSPGMTIFSPCRVAAAVSLTVVLLGGISVAIWALGEKNAENGKISLKEGKKSKRDKYA